MPRPSLDDLAVERACPLDVLGALLVGRGVVVLLSAVGRRDEVQHGVVSVEQLLIVDAAQPSDLRPHGFVEICRDVERSPVADDEHRFVDGLRHVVEIVFEGELRFEGVLLALVEPLLVLRQVVHTGLQEDGRHFRNGEHLEAAAGEVLHDSDQGCSLTGTRSAREYYSFYVFHFCVEAARRRCLLLLRKVRHFLSHGKGKVHFFLRWHQYALPVAVGRLERLMCKL